MLEQIVNQKKIRLHEQKQQRSLRDLIKRVEDLDTIKPQKSFYQSLSNNNKLAIIAEIKKASPSKGILSHDFRYLEYAKTYNLFADAISVLTEEDYFMGSTAYLTKIKSIVSIPILRKDFIIDPYQIYESKLIGADAILLICKILQPKQLTQFIQMADALGMDCLVEVHDEQEVEMALEGGARLIGINNRNLKTFVVDFNTTAKLAARIPKEILKVSESGIRRSEQMQLAKAWGMSGVLIGEELIKAESLEQKFMSLRGEND